MNIEMAATKLVVRDVDAAEGFYRTLGFKVVGRNVGGEGEVRQEQCWLSASGQAGAHVLILSRFLELPLPPQPVYPGEAWLAIKVPDVDATLKTVEAAGGMVVRPSQDRPEHGVRAAVVTDRDGHIIEVVGPLLRAPSQ